MRHAGKWGPITALLATTPLAYLAWQELLLVTALAAGALAGSLSFRAGWQYFQGAEESQWLLMLAFAFSGWPLLQLWHMDDSTQTEQTAISVQYFATVIAVWLCLAWCFLRGQHKSDSNEKGPD